MIVTLVSKKTNFVNFKGYRRTELLSRLRVIYATNRIKVPKVIPIISLNITYNLTNFGYFLAGVIY